MSPLGSPPPSLVGFPRFLLKPNRALFRIHHVARGPWFFSSSPAGRFNLRPPRGTCYLALEPIGAFLEVLGRQGAIVDPVDVAARRLSVLHGPRPFLLANCVAGRARAFGITAGIHATESYVSTQTWAEAFADAGFHGVRYLASHDPRQRSLAVAIFGSAGDARWPVTEERLIDDDLLRLVRRRFGIIVARVP